MQKELDEYNELFTPFEWTYSPYTEMWYKDGADFIPEFPFDNADNTFDIKHYLNGDRYMTSIDNYYESMAEEEFNHYIEYLFGLHNHLYDSFNITVFFIADKYKSQKICILENDLINLEQFINDIDAKNSTQFYLKQLYFEQFFGAKMFVWAKPDNKIHFAIQQYPVYAYKKLKNEDFEVVFNIVADKDDFVKQVRNMINYYKEKCKNAIFDYQRKHLDKELSYRDETFTYWVLKDLDL